MAPAVSNNKPGKLKPSERRKARSLALQALYQWQIADSPLSTIEAEFRADNSVGKKAKVDWEFFHALLNGVHKNVVEIDAKISPLLDRKIASLDPIELALLRMGTYELTDRIDVPYKVVINESVELAKTFGATDSYKYVNGILDRAAKLFRPLERSP